MKFTLCSQDPCKHNHILKAFLLTALLSCCVHGASRQPAIIDYVPISSVTISSNVSSFRLLWENEDSAQLNCTARGSEPVFSWMHNEIVLPQNSRYSLSDDGSSVTISPVTREDTGPFQCIASNSAGKKISDTVSLPIISWRPTSFIQCAVFNSRNVGETFLHCSWPGGNPPATVTLIHPNVTGIGTNNVTVNIAQSSLMGGTEMSCYGSQKGHNQSCTLLFEFPNDPNYQYHIVSVTEGEDLSLEVNLKQSSQSVSVLPATFRWFINSSLSFPPDELVFATSTPTFSKLRNFRVTEKSTGDYRCEAVNLMGTTNFSFAVLTTKRQVAHPVSTELFGGAIAGIMVGIVALLVLTGVGSFFAGRRSREQKPRQNHSLDPIKSQPAESMYVNLENPSVDSIYVNLSHKAVGSNYENMIHKAVDSNYMNIIRKAE